MLEIMPIANWFKDTLDNPINNLNNGFDIKTLAESRQIYKSSDNIPDLGEKERRLNKERDILRNRLYRH